MEWSNEVVMEFLDLYAQEEIIWFSKHPQHKNRNAVQNAWKRIEKKMSIECITKELKKKKDSLMATFRPLFNKVKATSGTGSGAVEVFKPTWFAYGKMESFLHGIYQPRTTENTENVDITCDNATVEDRQNSANNDKEAGTYEQEHTQVSLEAENTVTVVNAAKTFKAPFIKKNLKKRYLDPVQERMDEAYKILKTVANTEKPKPNQCSLYGQLVAEKLEGFDELTRVMIMHDIDNILFRAKINQLSQQSHKMIPPPQQPHVSPISRSTSPTTYYSQPSREQMFMTEVPALNSDIQSPSFSQPTSPATSYDSQPSPQQMFQHTYKQSSTQSTTQSTGLTAPAHSQSQYNDVNPGDKLTYLI